MVVNGRDTIGHLVCRYLFQIFKTNHTLIPMNRRRVALNMLNIFQRTCILDNLQLPGTLEYALFELDLDHIFDLKIIAIAID